METLLIKNALLYDGQGSEPYPGSLLVEGERIAAVGAVPAGEFDKAIDAGGRIACPGFIDLHRHCDFAALAPGFGSIELAQGITSTLCGPCGMAAFPSPEDTDTCRRYEDFLRPCLGSLPGERRFGSLPAWGRAVEAAGTPLNLGTLVGAGAVQVAVNGFSPEPLTPAQLDKAQGLIGQALQAGAFGVSMGIMYVPECYLPGPQRLALLVPLRQRGGTLFCHIRGEGDMLEASVLEVINLAARAQVPLQISHFKAVGQNNWGAGLQRAIEHIETARARGQDVTVDFYPYTGGSTTLFSLVPPALMAKGSEAALARFATATGQQELEDALAQPHSGWDNMLAAIGAQRILLSSSQAHPQYVGLSLAKIAQRMDQPGYGACIARLLAESAGQAGVILMSMDPEDVKAIARLPYSMLISDSLYAGTGAPHPRLYGSFPKFLREFCGPGGVLPYTEGIRRMTALPAARAGLGTRGSLQPGKMADLLLFHPQALRDKATYEAPRQPAEGLDMAMVAGRTVWENGAVAAQRAGRLLRKSATG